MARSLDCRPFLKALSGRTRWRIVEELLLRPKTVTELTKTLKSTQYTISRHLRILREAGLVQTVKQGKYVHCQIMPTYQDRVSNQLDLGCCVFHFERRCC